MKIFQGRVVTPGEVTAEAVVTHEGFNTLASLQKALQFGDKTVTVGDQNNKDLFSIEILYCFYQKQKCCLKRVSLLHP